MAARGKLTTPNQRLMPKRFDPTAVGIPGATAPGCLTPPCLLVGSLRDDTQPRKVLLFFPVAWLLKSHDNSGLSAVELSYERRGDFYVKTLHRGGRRVYNLACLNFYNESANSSGSSN